MSNNCVFQTKSHFLGMAHYFRLLYPLENMSALNSLKNSKNNVSNISNIPRYVTFSIYFIYWRNKLNMLSIYIPKYSITIVFTNMCTKCGEENWRCHDSHVPATCPHRRNHVSPPELSSTHFVNMFVSMFVSMTVNMFVNMFVICIAINTSKLMYDNVHKIP